MKKVCITGVNGLLGRKLVEALRGRYAILGLDLHDGASTGPADLAYRQTDITDREGTAEIIQAFDPACVFHTASFTDVDGCERDKDRAQRVNVEGTKHVALACKATGAVMIHVSTDYVFDGTNGPYSEKDAPRPISVYGRTKLESEAVVSELLDDHIIARTMVLYGFAPGVRPNFVTWLVDALRAGQPVRIVNDQYGTPTLADYLAATMVALYEQGRRGLYHTAGSELIHRYAFALRIADAFDLDNSLIGETTSETFNQDAPRPLRSGLEIDKLVRDTGMHIQDVRQGLGEVKRQMEIVHKSRDRQNEGS